MNSKKGESTSSVLSISYEGGNSLFIHEAFGDNFGESSLSRATIHSVNTFPVLSIEVMNKVEMLKASF